MLFTGRLETARRALATRYRYHQILAVRGARYSLRELRATQARIEADWDYWTQRGFEVNNIGLDEERNAVTVGMENPSREAKAAFRERYGPSVIVNGMVIRAF